MVMIDCLMKSNQTLFDKVDAMRQETAVRESERAEAARQKAEENRRRMPEVSRIVDVFREISPDVKVVFASENGVTVGQPSPEGIRLSETSASGSLSARKP